MAHRNSFDVTFMLGVHGIFDEFEPAFLHLINWTKPGGRIYVFGSFNTYPIDVWVKYRLVDGHDLAHREPGWNMFSKASISRFLDETVDVGGHKFTQFELPFDLEPNACDLARTWTFSDSAGRRLFTNGLAIIVNREFLEICIEETS